MFSLISSDSRSDSVATVKSVAILLRDDAKLALLPVCDLKLRATDGGLTELRLPPHCRRLRAAPSPCVATQGTGSLARRTRWLWPSGSVPPGVPTLQQSLSLRHLAPLPCMLCWPHGDGSPCTIATGDTRLALLPSCVRSSCSVILPILLLAILDRGESRPGRLMSNSYGELLVLDDAPDASLDRWELSLDRRENR